MAADRERDASQRGRKEATETDVKDKSTLNNLNDGSGNDSVFFLDLFDRAPGALVLCALLGQDKTAFFVFLLEDKSLYGVADFNYLVRVNIMFDGQLTRWDDTFGLVTDVEENLIAVNLDDGAFYDVAIVEVLDGGVNCGEEILFGANVVDSNLWGGDGH